MNNKSRENYVNFCKKHNIVPNIKGMKNWSKLMKQGDNMEGIDYNFMALAACVLNIKLSRDKALSIMGIKEKNITKEIPKDNLVIKNCEKENIEKLYYEQKLSMKKVGEIYNVSQATMHNYFVRNDMKARASGRMLEVK